MPLLVTESAHGAAWRVRYHRSVDRTIKEAGGLDSSLFSPSLRQLVLGLAASPKQFPKKSGELSELRAAPLRYADGIAWRAVFELDEAMREIRVLALAPHDRAYLDASRRRR